MKKIVILCFFIVSIVIAKRPFGNYDAIVNLGGDCQVTHQLKLHGLRSCALPFDWLITPFNSLYALLERKFDNFLNKDSLQFIDNCKNAYIEDMIYGVRMIHDFKLNEEFLIDYEEIKAKYTMRIERLYAILTQSRKVLFMRKGITREQALKLKALLESLFPHLEYTLVAIGGQEDIKISWNIPNVVNYYLRQPVPYSWIGDTQAWKEILEECNAFNKIFISLLQFLLLV